MSDIPRPTSNDVRKAADFLGRKAGVRKGTVTESQILRLFEDPREGLKEIFASQDREVKEDLVVRLVSEFTRQFRLEQRKIIDPPVPAVAASDVREVQEWPPDMLSWVETSLIQGVVSVLSTGVPSWGEIPAPPESYRATWEQCVNALEAVAVSDEMERIAEYIRVLARWTTTFGVVPHVDMDNENRLQLTFARFREVRKYVRGTSEISAYFLPKDQEGISPMPHYNEPLHSVFVPDAFFDRAVHNARVTQNNRYADMRRVMPNLREWEYDKSRARAKLSPDDATLKAILFAGILPEELRHGWDADAVPTTGFFCTPEIVRQRTEELLQRGGALSSINEGLEQMEAAEASVVAKGRMSLYEFAGKMTAVATGDPRVVLIDCRESLATLQSLYRNSVTLRELLRADNTNPYQICTILMLSRMGEAKGWCRTPAMDDVCNLPVLTTVLDRVEKMALPEIRLLVKAATAGELKVAVDEPPFAQVTDDGKLRQPEVEG